MEDLKLAVKASSTKYHMAVAQSKQYERLLRKPCQIMCIKSEVVVL